MKITLCGSIAFYDTMLAVKEECVRRGHEVQLPPVEVRDGDGHMISVVEYYAIRHRAERGDAWVWDRKEEAIREHFRKISWADAVIVVNEEKNGVKGYIGANTLIEMGLALYLRKPIYLWNDIPDMSCTEEILGMKPMVLNGALERIRA